QHGFKDTGCFIEGRERRSGFLAVLDTRLALAVIAEPRHFQYAGAKRIGRRIDISHAMYGPIGSHRYSGIVYEGLFPDAVLHDPHRVARRTDPATPGKAVEA